MAKKDFEQRKKERFESRQDNKVYKPPRIKPRPGILYSPFPEYPEDVIINGYKKSKADRYIYYLDSFWNVPDLAFPWRRKKPEIIFEDDIGLVIIPPREPMMQYTHYVQYSSIINSVKVLTKDNRLIELKLIYYIGGEGMAKTGEIILSNGDTDDWVRVDFETFSKGGQILLNFIKLTVKDKAFDIQRKCWFIHADTMNPLLEGIKVLINQGSLGKYSITDNRTTVEDFDSFFNHQANEIRTASPLLSRASLLKELEHICKEQASVHVSIREDADILSLKPYYRKAALALHPDRNNGDGSRMSHLNMIWAELQQYS